MKFITGTSKLVYTIFILYRIKQIVQNDNKKKKKPSVNRFSDVWQEIYFKSLDVKKKKKKIARNSKDVYYYFFFSVLNIRTEENVLVCLYVIERIYKSYSRPNSSNIHSRIERSSAHLSSIDYIVCASKNNTIFQS